MKYFNLKDLLSYRGVAPLVHLSPLSFRLRKGSLMARVDNSRRAFLFRQLCAAIIRSSEIYDCRMGQNSRCSAKGRQGHCIAPGYGRNEAPDRGTIQKALWDRSRERYSDLAF